MSARRAVVVHVNPTWRGQETNLAAVLLVTVVGLLTSFLVQASLGMW
jgi:hypothetical protein